MNHRHVGPKQRPGEHYKQLIHSTERGCSTVKVEKEQGGVLILQCRATVHKYVTLRHMCNSFLKKMRVDVFQLAQILLNICHIQEGQLCTVMSTLCVLHLLSPNGALQNET